MDVFIYLCCRSINVSKVLVLIFPVTLTGKANFVYILCSVDIKSLPKVFVTAVYLDFLSI